MKTRLNAELAFSSVLCAVFLLLACGQAATSTPMPTRQPTPTPEPIRTDIRLYLECLKNISAWRCAEADFTRYVVADDVVVRVWEDDKGFIQIECEVAQGQAPCYQLPTPVPPTPTNTSTPLPTFTPAPWNLASEAMRNACLKVVRVPLGGRAVIYCGDVREWKIVTFLWHHEFDATDTDYYGTYWVPIESSAVGKDEILLRPSDELVSQLSDKYYLSVRNCEYHTGLTADSSFSSGDHCKNIPALIYERAMGPVTECVAAQDYYVPSPKFFRSELVSLAKGKYDPENRCRTFYLE